MRIDLLDRGKKRRSRRKRPGSKSRSLTFHDTITLAEPRLKRETNDRRMRLRRRRVRQRRQTSQMEAAAPSAIQRRFPWRTVLRRVPAVLILAGLIGTVVYTSTAEEVFVYQARIKGAHHLDADAIYQAAGVHEQNIFWVRPQEAARRIMQMDGVRAARVWCDILPAEVAIELEEREPVVMWRALTQERDWWLDEEGVVLPYHGDPNAPDTVFVVDSSERHLGVGDRIVPDGIVRSVYQLAEALPGTQIFFYHADRGLSFTHRLGEGEWPVYMGTSENLERKIAVVQAMTDYFLAHGIHPRYVDVRWPDHPVYGRPAGEGAAESE